MPGYKPQVKTNSGMVDIPIAATYDENGDNIVATYATKEELSAAGQFDPNGTYPNLTAGKATHAQSADSATNATNDGQGRNIASTYALKGEGGKIYRHRIEMNGSISGDDIQITLYLDINSSSATEFDDISLQQFLLTRSPYPFFGNSINGSIEKAIGGIITRWFSPVQGMYFKIFGDSKENKFIGENDLIDTVYEI